MSDNASSIPKLVKDDDWLEPYADHISWRMIRLQDHLREIEASSGSIEAYASAHKYVGIHYHLNDDTWTVREWAPEAKYMALVGDFNHWDAGAHPLIKADNGIWEATLPGGVIKHGDKVKLHIAGADDSARDRIPATIHRCIQDEVTHDYAGQIWQAEDDYVWKNTFDPSSIRAPLIYEAHVGMAGEEARLHTYREFADDTLPRIAKLGYNTVQLMPSKLGATLLISIDLIRKSIIWLMTL